VNRDDPILRKCRAGLEALYGSRLKGIILFGSTARGQDTPESDIDLLVLLDGPVNGVAEVRRIWHALYPVQLECDRLISIMPADADRYQKGESALYENVLEEGVPI
jgi:predicted nucleotidyltransferase